MKEIIKGHVYELDDLKTGTKTQLSFYMDPKIHKIEIKGPSTQEVIRACISRVKSLNEERPHPFNDLILTKLREVIILFESRALLMDVEKGLEIENIPVNKKGHFSIINTESTDSFDVSSAIGYIEKHAKDLTIDLSSSDDDDSDVKDEVKVGYRNAMLNLITIFKNHRNT